MMKQVRSKKFLTKPPLWRMGVLLGVGLALILCAYIYGLSCRPPELPNSISDVGLGKVREILELVGKSDFGRSTRGTMLTAEALELMNDGRVRFSPNMEEEALYRKELWRRPILYISVFSHRDRVIWPRPEELAERIYHESLHGVIQSKHRSIEEECDAFCAAEEAAAAVGQRSPRYPVIRDGATVWSWAKKAYSDYPSDRAYVPVGCTLKELAVRTGIIY